MRNESSQRLEIDLALCRSAIYEALALGFRPPTVATIERLVSEYQNRALVEIAAMLQTNPQNGQLESLAARVRQLSFCADARELESLQISYRHLFGHTAHPQAPPYETEYGEEALFQQPQELGDLAGFYSAFGLKLNTFERVDHISCECEFLCFLSRKKAYALENHDAAMMEETRKAQRFFLKDHLGRFVPAFAKLLSREKAFQNLHEKWFQRLGLVNPLRQVLTLWPILTEATSRCLLIKSRSKKTLGAELYLAPEAFGLNARASSTSLFSSAPSTVPKENYRKPSRFSLITTPTRIVS